mgnify:CR=1 FL=1
MSIAQTNKSYAQERQADDRDESKRAPSAHSTPYRNHRGAGRIFIASGPFERWRFHGCYGRPGDGGYGDCLALEQPARAAAERGADALAISPIHALSAIDQTHYSPYSPSSRLLLNTLYASPAALLGEREVRVAIEACGLEQQLEDLEQGPLVDWPRAASARQRLLEALYQGFSQGDHPLRKDFDSFRKAGGQAL